MGYRGKTHEHERARTLRAAAWTLQEIADELGVAKRSVSLWVRDVEFVSRPRRPGPDRRPHPGSPGRRRRSPPHSTKGGSASGA